MGTRRDHGRDERSSTVQQWPPEALDRSASSGWKLPQALTLACQKFDQSHRLKCAAAATQCLAMRQVARDSSSFTLALETLRRNRFIAPPPRASTAPPSSHSKQRVHTEGRAPPPKLRQSGRGVAAGPGSHASAAAEDACEVSSSEWGSEDESVSDESGAAGNDEDERLSVRSTGSEHLDEEGQVVVAAAAVAEGDGNGASTIELQPLTRRGGSPAEAPRDHRPVSRAPPLAKVDQQAPAEGAPSRGRRSRQLKSERRRERAAVPPWDMMRSIWAPRAAWCDSKGLVDSVEVERQRVANDWRRASVLGIDSLVDVNGGAGRDANGGAGRDGNGGAGRDGNGVAAELKEIGEVLFEHRHVYQALFSYYTCIGTDVAYLYLNEWSQFVTDFGIASNKSKLLKKSDLDRLFIAVDTRADRYQQACQKEMAKTAAGPKSSSTSPTRSPPPSGRQNVQHWTVTPSCSPSPPNQPRSTSPCTAAAAAAAAATSSIEVAKPDALPGHRVQGTWHGPDALLGHRVQGTGHGPDALLGHATFTSPPSTSSSPPPPSPPPLSPPVASPPPLSSPSTSHATSAALRDVLAKKKAFSRIEFVVALVHIAVFRYMSSKKLSDVSEALERLLRYDIAPLLDPCIFGTTLTNAYRERCCYTREVDATLRRHEPSLRELFKASCRPDAAAGREKTELMSFDEFKALMRGLSILADGDVSERQVRRRYMHAHVHAYMRSC